MSCTVCVRLPVNDPCAVAPVRVGADVILYFHMSPADRIGLGASARTLGGRSTSILAEMMSRRVACFFTAVNRDNPVQGIEGGEVLRFSLSRVGIPYFRCHT